MSAHETTQTLVRETRWPVDIGCDAIADLAVECLMSELETFPKPGLVSPIDAGSHADMDAGTFRASARAIRPYLGDIARAGAEGCAMATLRVLGVAAEAAMLDATGGVNTHRGAIFGLGLLCAAAGHRAGSRDSATLGAIVSLLWGASIRNAPLPIGSHGVTALRRYGAGGARCEAASGFPTVYRIGVPALRRGRRLAPGDAEAARVEACFALVAALEDTNLLHRAGEPGLRFARRAAERFLADGGVGRSGWRARARAVHEAFVARDLSPGGSADLLAMTLMVDALDRPAAISGRDPATG